MLLAEFIKGGVKDLESLYPAEEARNIVLMLCESVLGTRSYTHIVEPDFVVNQSKEAVLDAALTRLCAGEPVQHVLGHTEFCGLRYKVTPDVLIPRPETELLVRTMVKEASRIQRSRLPYGRNAAPVRVLDLCTGSGCIAWSIAMEVPGAEVVAVDISESALDVAKEQFTGHDIKEKGIVPPLFVKADILDIGQDFDHGMFDLIVSNPPYVCESEKVSMHRNVLEYEPAQALFVPDEDPLVFHRAVARWSLRYLNPDGKGMTEINEQLGPQVQELFRESGFRGTELVKDFFDRNRFVIYSRNGL